MKATGIVRRIDDLGRVVIPKEIRRTMRIREGEPKEIYGIYGSDADIGFQSPDNAEVLFRTDTGVTCFVNLGFYRVPGKSEVCVYGY